ncbi:hypothetical protein A3K01_02050 [candidate division WWE3 bacterium RIFOXYD1_FULL_43_17]|uniref:Uncharacterized protein n=3 Tax=Katanobacteria TaxID=422282 RepID=A0A1F4XGR9_UNCKA|nr:MAG: hypothetical protein UU59_C0008G0007 [candidate division WWE3 bacterium GW2011_GWE1_41_27]KKS60165.1 MAG: hypothetical protein UV26_C0007G0007 [candidate division WWE3 bacterium GW2011_GWF2_42_42]OGC80889.1 MAG: hypothetical protein A3K01_02050 [candidate division WWE3 bacterium RIFOXYD1_FULL_43_17]
MAIWTKTPLWGRILAGCIVVALLVAAVVLVNTLGSKPSVVAAQETQLQEKDAEIQSLQDQVKNLQADYLKQAETFGALRTEIDALKAVQAQRLDENPVVVVNQAPEEKEFVWDGKSFQGLAPFFFDGDPLIAQHKERGKDMTYECSKDYGVFFTMDSGVVQDEPTVYHEKKYGAVGFVPCTEGKLIQLWTEHWSESALHNQVHIVELYLPLPESVTVEQALEALMKDDGKPLAYMFAADGTHELIVGDQLK